jgi:cytochrome P450
MTTQPTETSSDVSACPVAGEGAGAAAEPLIVDPYSESFQQLPFPAYRRLREQQPVYRVPGEDWYMVTTMELVREVLRDPVTYASSAPVGRRVDPPADIAEEVAAIRAQGFAYQPALNLSDPPVHTHYRRLVNRAFTPRSLAWMEPLVDRAARELTEALVDGEVVDIIAAVARPLPIFAIARILGLPDERRAEVARWSDAATAALGAKLSNEKWLEVERDVLDFQLSLAAELDERRKAPREDLLSTLVRPAPGEEPLSNRELVWLVRELLVAGNETTTRALAEIVRCLSAQPDPWRAIREDPGSIAGIVEEGVRLSSPAFGLFRRTTREVSLGAVTVPANTSLYLAYGSANRDDAAFDNPDAFDPTRANLRDHMAFGHGIHVCVGSGLARLEASATLRALADNVDGLHVSPDAELRYIPSFLVRGIIELPVLVQRRQGS